MSQKGTDLWNKALKSFRADPRGRTHWLVTNTLFDNILKTNLKDSLILKYNPEEWLKFLFDIYHNLRIPYWQEFYDRMIRKLEDGFFGIFNLPISIPLETPIYIRIISLLIRILIDRIGLTEYKRLESIPGHLYAEMELTQTFTITPFGHVENYFTFLDKITNNASKEIIEFFKEARGDSPKYNETIMRERLLPIPMYEFAGYEAFQNAMQKKFSGSLSRQDGFSDGQVPTIDGGFEPIIYHEPAVFNFINDALFKRKVLSHIIKFLTDIHADLSNINDSLEFKGICEFFHHFLQHIMLQPNELITGDCHPLFKEIIKFDLSVDILDKLTYRPGEDTVLADPFSVDELFRHSLDLFDKPLIHSSTGKVIFSIFWLFDSLIYKITWALSNNAIGGIRGIRAENYFAYICADYVKDLKNAPFTGPFKIILTNKNPNLRGPTYFKVEKNAAEFKYPVYELFLSEKDIGIARFRYIEYDVAFVFYDTLFLIELKDNLYWDIRDIPVGILLWAENVNEKLKKNSEILNLPVVKNKLGQKGILYTNINSITITQSPINSKIIKFPYDLFNLLENIHVKNVEGEKYTSILLEYHFPPDPWKLRG